MTDATLEPLSRHRRLLHDCAAVRLPGADVLSLVSDKYRTVSLADELGIPVPPTALIESSADFRHLAEFSFPVVVKDRFSVRLTGDQVVRGTTAYAYSQEELARKVRERVELAGDVLVQEFVPGIGVGFSFFAHRGQLYLPFQWQRIREKDPRGSGSAVRKSVPLDELVVRYGRELIGAAEFDGIGMVEFKQDRTSGRLVLMEINGRPWGSLQLPIHCGIDYPHHLVEWHLHRTLPPMQIDYRKGITCRWLAADLAHLEKLWEGKPPGWPIEYPSFVWSLLKIAVPWYPGLRYDDLWLSDPKPGIAGIGQWLSSHFRKNGC
jgi:predicted ATP-grasp superfamily ATP-dependent carboligase